MRELLEIQRLGRCHWLKPSSTVANDHASADSSDNSVCDLIDFASHDAMLLCRYGDAPDWRRMDLGSFAARAMNDWFRLSQASGESNSPMVVVAIDELPCAGQHVDVARFVDFGERRRIPRSSRHSDELIAHGRR